MAGNSRLSSTEVAHAAACDYSFEVVVIGDSEVGKSSLVQRYLHDRYYNHGRSTIGVDLERRTIQVNGKSVRIQLWDTTGQERFRAVTTGYYRRANGIMLVYDVTRPESVENLRSIWMKEIESYAQDEVRFVLVGNKTDLPVQDEHIAYRTEAAVSDLLTEYPQLKHVQTSAKENVNVCTAFEELVEEMIEHENTVGRSLSRHTRESFHLASPKKKWYSRCC